MTLVEQRQEGHGVVRNRMVECPICGVSIAKYEKAHLHIEEHDPEDLGLTPLGVRRSPFIPAFVFPPEPSTIYLHRSGARR